jgi:hypothetical protein
MNDNPHLQIVARARERRVLAPLRIVWMAIAFLALTMGAARAEVTDYVVTAKPDMTAYLLNGSENPALTLTRGHTYRFMINSGANHPFFIETVQGTGTGNSYDDGVSLSEGRTSGVLTFTVPASGPSNLFYQCSVHNLMHGSITIASSAVPATGPFVMACLFALCLGAGLVALRRRGVPA